MKLHPPVKNLTLAKHPNGDVTQWFAENPVMYSRIGLPGGHNGIDIVRPHGEPLYAVEDGTVVGVRSDPNGFGRHVRFVSDAKDHNGLHREWVYAHNSAHYVKTGDRVTAGQHIADMGNTGFVVSGSTPYWKHNPYAGTHLHLGLRLVKITNRGWSYPLSKIKLDVMDYDNGFRGAVDPVPYLESDLGENAWMFRQLLTIQSVINDLRRLLRL